MLNCEGIISISIGDFSQEEADSLILLLFIKQALKIKYIQSKYFLTKFKYISMRHWQKFVPNFWRKTVPTLLLGNHSLQALNKPQAAESAETFLLVVKPVFLCS